ncbi:hypothetical protein AEGHOMDF_0683 [Methylobacterium soli]|nr:hypothetical protein AEGHOMDF_0683 [Methylobacterium soli]
MRQGCGPLGGALGGMHVAVEVVEPPLAQAGLHQLQAAGDRREQVVEVMRQAARELADGLHFLRLPQGVLGLSQQGRLLMLGSGLTPGRVDLPLLERARPGEPAVGTVRVAQTVLVRLGERRLEDAGERGLRGSQILRVGERHKALPDEIGCLPSQLLRPGGIDLGQNSVRPGDDEEVPREPPSAIQGARTLGHAGLQRRVEILQGDAGLLGCPARLKELPFVPPPVGGVEHRNPDEPDAACVVSTDDGVDEHGQRCPVRAHEVEGNLVEETLHA